MTTQFIYSALSGTRLQQWISQSSIHNTCEWVCKINLLILQQAPNRKESSLKGFHQSCVYTNILIFYHNISTMYSSTFHKCLLCSERFFFSKAGMCFLFHTYHDLLCLHQQHSNTKHLEISGYTAKRKIRKLVKHWYLLKNNIFK